MPVTLTGPSVASDHRRGNSITRPNILFILLDNVGFGDPGCYGGGITRRAPTPRLDQLAA